MSACPGQPNYVIGQVKPHAWLSAVSSRIFYCSWVNVNNRNYHNVHLPIKWFFSRTSKNEVWYVWHDKWPKMSSPVHVYVDLDPPPPTCGHKLSIWTIMRQQSSNKLGVPPFTLYSGYIYEEMYLYWYLSTLKCTWVQW